MTGDLSTTAIAGVEVLKPNDVAASLGVSRSWLYEAAKEGRIPCVRLGGPDGPLRFIAADLAAWLEEARRGWVPGESRVATAARASGARAA